MFGKTGSIPKIQCESTRGNQWIHSSITSHWVFRLVTLVAKNSALLYQTEGCLVVGMDLLRQRVLMLLTFLLWLLHQLTAEWLIFVR